MPSPYVSFGVPYYWLGDPDKRMLETFVLNRGLFKPSDFCRDDEQVAAQPFAEIAFALSRLWAD